MVFKRFQKKNERFKRTMFKFKDNPLIFELGGLRSRSNRHLEGFNSV